jgi:hypothetical protein
MGIVTKKNQMYSSKRKFVHGSGFVDSLSSTLRGIGSYIYQNKDLIAKPMLGAVGQVGALALTEGVKAGLRKALQNSENKVAKTSKLDPKSMEILEEIIKTSSSNNIPVSNILGGGMKKNYI